MALDVGAQAPDFTLPAHTGEDVSLSGLRGKKVIVFFFPRGFTAGWTNEVTVFKTVSDKVHAEGGEILGISVDHVPSHKAWAENLGGVPFPLVADWSQTTASDYGVHDPERRVAKRVTYVLDRDGVIRFVNPAMDPRSQDHYDAIMKAFDDIE
jgi:peroxiredoxin